MMEKGREEITPLLSLPLSLCLSPSSSYPLRLSVCLSLSLSVTQVAELPMLNPTHLLAANMGYLFVLMLLYRAMQKREKYELKWFMR
jgi:hypothetical protein